MAKLHVDLQEGFADDKVVVRVNGLEIFCQENLTSRPELGLAKTLEAEVEPGQVNIEVALPEKKLSKSIETEVRTETWVAFSIDHKTGKFVEPKVQDTLFGYV
jgi:hypothetical protein